MSQIPRTFTPDLNYPIPTPIFEEEPTNCLSNSQSSDILLNFEIPLITAPALSRLLTTPSNKRYKIVDARYPYEFEGGHISGAINVQTTPQLIKIYQSQQNTDTTFIFHCELSKNRGRELARQFRNIDRHFNKYPHLSFPEIYLLEGGYKNFYNMFPDMCVGGYVPMRSTFYIETGTLKKYHAASSRDKKIYRATSLPGSRSIYDILRDEANSDDTQNGQNIQHSSQPVNLVSGC